MSHLRFKKSFFDISKAFDKYDMKVESKRYLGISRYLLRLLKGFLFNEKQKVVLNGQYSN